MSADTVVNITQTNGTTKEILNFVGSRMDSLAPVLKEATKTVADNVGHYGKEWVAFRAWEFFSSALYDILILGLSGLLGYFGLLLWKKFYGIMMDEKMKQNKENPLFLTGIFGGIISVVAFILFVASTISLSSSFPRAIAAISHPEGLAVQMIIEGLKK